MKPTDDSPNPATWQSAWSLANDLLKIGTQLSKLEIQTRQLAPYIKGDSPAVRALAAQIRHAASLAIDTSMDVRLGRLPIVPPPASPSPAPSNQPLIEQIEKNRKPLLDGLDAIDRIVERAAPGEPVPPAVPSAARDRDESDRSTQSVLERPAAAFEPRFAENGDHLKPIPPSAGPRNGFVELEDEPAKPRRKPHHDWSAFAIDPYGTFVSLGTVSLPTRDPGQALEMARSAFPGVQYESMRAGVRDVDPERIAVFRAASPEAVRAASGLPRPPEPEPADVIEKDFERVLEAESDANAEEVADEPIELNPPAEDGWDPAMWFRVPGIRPGGKYASEGIGIGKTLKELGKISIAGWSLKRGQIGTARIVWVPGTRLGDPPSPYAVTGGFYPGNQDARPDEIELNPLCEESLWRGPIFGIEHLNPVSGYYGVRAKCREGVFVLAHKEQRIKLLFTRSAGPSISANASSPENGSTEPDPETTVGELAAEERRAKKREADRKYQAAKKAKRDLARAIGNPVEGNGEPPPVFRGREPVIAEPTEPARTMGQAMLADRPGEEWRSLDIDQLGISYTLCAKLRDREITNAGQLAYALNDELGLMGETEIDVIELEKAIERVKPKPAAAVPARRSKPAPEPPCADDIFVEWSGRNPIHAIRAPSLLAAVEWARANHPKGAKVDVRPDDGVYAKRNLHLRIDLKTPSPIESDRTWEVFDTRFDPHPLMGEVTGANITRAALAAEAKWPDVPARMIRLWEKGSRGGARRQSSKPDPDTELAEFRKGFERYDELEQAATERMPADPEPAKRGRKRSEVGS